MNYENFSDQCDVYYQRINNHINNVLKGYPGYELSLEEGVMTVFYKGCISFQFFIKKEESKKYFGFHIPFFTVDQSVEKWKETLENQNKAYDKLYKSKWTDGGQ